MVFSSVTFLCFFLPLTIILYYIMPNKYRNYILLIMSIFFYAFGGLEAVPILLVSIIGNYIFGRLIFRGGGVENSVSTVQRKVLLIFAVAFNLCILGWFKYANLLVDTLTRGLKIELEWKEIILPIGISFFTFQGLSYVIDVYREAGKGNEYCQKNVFDLALYISMFPQLIAGPIVRYESIRTELHNRKHSYEKFYSGIERFTIGLAKKVLLADYLGETASLIMFENIDKINAPTAWLGAIAYSLQIYYDFSGYSDMAIGLGRMFGFEFMENFSYPYISKSITDFWRRWHISLSSWFKDYLYIPLGGNRKGNVYIHLAIVFLATGIWHGAAWGFLLWGVWHGIFIIIEKFCKTRLKNRIENLRGFKILGWLYTTVIVVIGWVLFSIVDIRQTIYYIGIMFGAVKNEFIAFSTSYFMTKRMILIMLIAVAGCYPWLQRVKNWCGERQGVSVAKFGGIMLLLVLSFVKIINNEYSPFIYFRF